MITLRGGEGCQPTTPIGEIRTGGILKRLVGRAILFLICDISVAGPNCKFDHMAASNLLFCQQKFGDDINSTDDIEDIAYAIVEWSALEYKRIRRELPEQAYGNFKNKDNKLIQMARGINLRFPAYQKMMWRRVELAAKSYLSLDGSQLSGLGRGGSPSTFRIDGPLKVRQDVFSLATIKIEKLKRTK